MPPVVKPSRRRRRFDIIIIIFYYGAVLSFDYWKCRPGRQVYRIMRRFFFFKYIFIFIICAVFNHSVTVMERPSNGRPKEIGGGVELYFSRFTPKSQTRPCLTDFNIESGLWFFGFFYWDMSETEIFGNSFLPENNLRLYFFFFLIFSQFHLPARKLIKH